MDDNKKEATRHLIESVKLTFTISSVFGAGLVAFSAYVEGDARFLGWALGLCFVALLSSILCLNTIVNKVWKQTDKLIYDCDVRVLWWIMTVTMVLSFILACAFIFTANKKVDTSGKKADDTELYLKAETIELKYNHSYDIEYSKDSAGGVQLNVRSSNHR